MAWPLIRKLPAKLRAGAVSGVTGEDTLAAGQPPPAQPPRISPDRTKMTDDQAAGLPRLHVWIVWTTATFGHDLIHAGRTIALLRRVVERQIVGDRHFGVGQGQMGGLIFLVIGAR